MDLFEIIDIMFNLMTIIVCFLFCIVEGFKAFNRIFPIRYGRNHVEVTGEVIGKENMKIGSFGSVVKIPVVQFVWKGTSYEIADKTSRIQKYEIGDNVIVCYNPRKNQDDAIIKRGIFAYGTFFIWLQMFLLAIGGYIGLMLGVLLLIY